MFHPHSAAKGLVILCLSALLVIFLFIQASATPDDNWTAPINISNTTTTPFSFSPTVAVDRQGMTHAVWTDSVYVPSPVNYLPDTWRNTIYYSRTEGAGFGTPIALATYEHRFYPYPISIVFDGNDNPWVFWIGTEATYTRWDGSAWTTPQTLSFLPLIRTFGAEFDGRYLQAISDKLGNIYVVVGSGFSTGQFGLMLTSWNGSEWSSPSFITDRIAHLSGAWRIDYGSPKLAVDALGHLHMVWFNRTSTFIYQILYSSFDGNSWTDPQVVFESQYFQGPPEIALDNFAQPHVVWDSYVNDFYIVGKYSTLHNGIWSTPEQFGEVTNGSTHIPKIKFDAAGVAHIVYIEHHGDGTPPTGIFHIQKQQNSWTQPKQIGPLAEGGEDGLDYDEHSDTLHVVWTTRNENPVMDVFYSRTVPLDSSPPISTISLEGVTGNDGWSKSDVTITITATDNDGGSGVKQITYSAAGANPIPETTVIGAGVQFSDMTEGQTIITYFAKDIAGNTELPQNITVKIDKSSPPVFCGVPDNQWHASNISIQCTASDGGSGLAHPSDANFALLTSVNANTEDGNAQTDNYDVCDVAGNCAHAGPIIGNKVDRNAPTINISTPTGITYSYHQAVAADYTCSDGGSGVNTCAGSVARGSRIDTSSVGAHSFTVTTTDNVGNTATATVNYIVKKGER